MWFALYYFTDITQYYFSFVNVKARSMKIIFIFVTYDEKLTSCLRFYELKHVFPKIMVADFILHLVAPKFNFVKLNWSVWIKVLY